jgi:hypothetical protein
MAKCFLFLFFGFFSIYKCNYFVTFLENSENFAVLKNNIGYIHKYHKEAIAIVVLDLESEAFNDICDQISFWKKVHVVDKRHIFLNYKNYIKMNYPTKAKLALIENIFNNFFVIEKTKILCFDIKISLFKSHQAIVKMLLSSNLSFSTSHIMISYEFYHKELRWLFAKYKLNTFGDNEIKYLQNYYTNLKHKTNEVRNMTLSCRINYKDLHYSALFAPENILKSFKANRIAILLPTLNSNEILEENPIFKHTIASLSRTITTHEMYQNIITIYIAYDVNDIFFKTENSVILHKRKILDAFGNSKNLSIKYRKFPVSKSVVFLWNSLFVESYINGNDYFVQLNDDTKILKSGWLTKSISFFKDGFDGVVGFNSEEWGCKLLTQTIVSRAHFLRNHGNYYPTIFHNSMSDIWLTEFYKNNRKCLVDVKTNNHFSKTRYKNCPFNRKLLKKLLHSFDVKF